MELSKIKKLNDIINKRKTIYTGETTIILMVNNETGELLKEITNLKKEQKDQILAWSEENKKEGVGI